MNKKMVSFAPVIFVLACLCCHAPAVLAQAQKTPFSASIEVEMNPGELEESKVFVQVPADKRLTITFVSVRAAVPVKQDALFSIRADNPDFVPLTFQGTFNLNEGVKSVFTANQAVIVFAGPGREVVGVFRRSKGLERTGPLIATIFGTLEDLP